MKITIVMGFFLPVPPAAGGAVEKTWHGLAQEFTRAGHDVTLISRTWPFWPREETSAGIHFLRLPGFNHRKKLWLNLLLDFIWSIRVFRRLPPADITVVNSVLLPCWLGWLKPSAGKVVVMPGRMPKGQFRIYNHIALVMATSTPVRDALLRESASWQTRTKIYGYPARVSAFASTPRQSRGEITVGFIGRLHHEKGLDLLLDAIALLAQRPNQNWRVLLCGPIEVAQGGSGKAYQQSFDRRLSALVGKARYELAPPEFDEAALARRYAEVDIFCYPSLAEKGETFGVAVVEAMATGAVPVVSNLSCFTDFVRPEQNGLVFDHRSENAAQQLAKAIATLLDQPQKRAQLAAQARRDACKYDFALYAGALLQDFADLYPQGREP